MVDRATAARTIAELEPRSPSSRGWKTWPYKCAARGTDRKWDELSKLLQDQAEMFDAHGHRRKLVIFTEHRDTLNYLTERIRTLLGKPEAVVTIQGGMGREERRRPRTPSRRTWPSRSCWRPMPRARASTSSAPT